MLLAVRTTTGRENIVIDSLTTKIKNENIAVKALVHPEELRGYIFIEGDLSVIEQAIKGVPHVRGIINKEVEMKDIEKFIVPEKQEIQAEIGDIVEIIIGPFKGEKGKVTRVDEKKNELTIELLEAAIPIPVTISLNSVRIHEKKKKENEPQL
ncbi:MAG: transcription elongation factor Spt5 [Candidatus Aenigmatarchaeota archaeon]|nr:MAG: transcription elongation factor Spt5 [Candidatus Aenigmarchaeota archaeon]